MKILVFSQWLINPLVGRMEGGEISLLDLLEELVRRANRVRVVVQKGTPKEADFETLNGVEVVRFATGGGRLGEIMGWLKNVPLQVKKFKPDIIFTQKTLYGLADKVCADLDYPTVSFIRSYHPICPKGSLLKNDDFTICDGNSIRKCRECLGFKAPRSYATTYTARQLAKNEANFVHTPRGKDLLHKIKKIVVGKITPFKFKELKIVDRGKFLLYMGGVTDRKGITYLNEAMKKLPAEKLVVAGDKHMDIKFNQNIQYVGRVPFSQVDKLYRESKLVVVPSIWPDPFPRVIFEAFQYGKQVITTDRICSNPYLEDEGVANTARVDNNFVENLKDKIQEVLGRGTSEDIIERQWKILERFTPQRCVDDLIEKLGEKGLFPN